MSNIDDHQKDYKPEIYNKYNHEELSQWVTLLVKRSQHRTSKKKALKDLDDAKNYLWMLSEKTKSRLKIGSMRKDNND